MSYNLFIDDQIHDFSRDDGRAIRDPKIIDPTRKYHAVASYYEAIDYMTKHGCPDFISFDHDYGDTNLPERNGFHVAEWMVDKDLDEPNWIPNNFNFQVHSKNIEGRKNILNLLNNYLKFKNSK